MARALFCLVPYARGREGAAYRIGRLIKILLRFVCITQGHGYFKICAAWSMNARVAL